MVDASLVVRSFFDLFDTLMNSGSLSVKEKELIALGIAAAGTCDPCIRLHVDNCLSANASPEEIIEAAGVAVVMAGGPACMNAKKIANILLRREDNAKN
jgi:AhpD family alkylhydroperoxidase